MRPDYCDPVQFSAAQRALTELIQRAQSAPAGEARALNPLAAHVLDCLRPENLQGIYLYEQPTGRHHADLLLRRTAPGLPRLIRVADDGAASREAAENAALQLVRVAIHRRERAA